MPRIMPVGVKEQIEEIVAKFNLESGFKMEIIYEETGLYNEEDEYGYTHIRQDFETDSNLTVYLSAQGNFRKKDGKWEVEDYFYGWCLRIEEGSLDSTVYIGNIDKINPENCAKFINSYKMKNRIEEIKSLKQKIKNIQDLIIAKEENIALAIIEVSLESIDDKDSEQLQQ
jgi:hypothetical protein